MITPVFSAAHISRMESVSDDRHPRRKRTRISDGEEQTETEVEVDHEPPPARASRKVKPLPAHVHGHRQQSGELLAGPTQTSTKESSHG